MAGVKYVADFFRFLFVPSVSRPTTRYYEDLSNHINPEGTEAVPVGCFHLKGYPQIQGVDDFPGLALSSFSSGSITSCCHVLEERIA
jgi:hypothetical protein